MKKITAIHEAAHVVTAYLSKYHFLSGKISLLSDTNGETYVSLSAKKIKKEAKEITQLILKDPEIIEDIAIILFAGYQAEIFYCDKKSAKVDSSFSINDYNYVDELIENASSLLTNSKLNLIAISKQLVIANWNAIETISETIIQSSNNSLDAVDAIEILDKMYK